MENLGNIMKISDGRKRDIVSLSMNFWEVQNSRSLVAPTLGRFARRAFERSADAIESDPDARVCVEVPVQKLPVIHEGLAAKAHRFEATLEKGHPEAVGVVVARARLPIVTGMLDTLSPYI